MLPLRYPDSSDSPGPPETEVLSGYQFGGGGGARPPGVHALEEMPRASNGLTGITTVHSYYVIC